MASECKAQMSDAVDKCLSAIVKTEESGALQVVTQIADQMAGALTYCDMLGDRTVTVDQPSFSGGTGASTTFEGAVPWDDSMHGHGFRGGMGRVDECTNDISHHKLGKEQYHAIGELLYQENSRFLKQEEGGPTYEGMLTVPGAPSLAPVGPGNDRYHRHA